MMWVIILLLVLIVTIGVLLYLTNRFSKFALIGKLSRGNKGICLAISAIIVLIIGLICFITMGVMNVTVVLLNLGVFFLICDGIAALIHKLTKKRAIKKVYLPGIVAITLTTVYLICGWYLAHHVAITTYTIDSAKNISPLRIVQFADSHIGNTFHADGFLKEMDKINSLNPDIVLLTGDFVDDSTTREDMIESCAALGTLKTTYGVYFSFGNHDKGYYSSEHRGYSSEDLVNELQKNNVIILEDEIVTLPGGYTLIGRQDKSEESRGSGRATMSELTSDINYDNFIIVMDHQPSDYTKEAASLVDLVLSGHTHGGQLIPITYVGEWIGVNDRTYGYEKRNVTNFIVSSGISDWAIKFKTGCKSEVVLIEIK